jgi:phosphoserine phosphatase
MNYRVTALGPAPIDQGFFAAQFPKADSAHCRPQTPTFIQFVADAPVTTAQRDAAHAAGFDLASIPAAWKWTDIGLLASDMDSTLITIECIDEIAAFAGVKPQVAAITERAMQGEIDFAAALRERVALLVGLPETVLERVYIERLRLTPGAEAIVQAAQQIGAKTLLVSGGFTFFTQRLQTKLGLSETLANVLGLRDGALTGRLESAVVDGQAKAAAVRAMQVKLPPGKLTIAMGDGANDLPMLACAELSVAYRAKPVVQAQAMVSIRHSGLDAIRLLFPA